MSVSAYLIENVKYRRVISLQSFSYVYIIVANNSEYSFGIHYIFGILKLYKNGRNIVFHLVDPHDSVHQSAICLCLLTCHS